MANEPLNPEARARALRWLEDENQPAHPEIMTREEYCAFRRISSDKGQDDRRRGIGPGPILDESARVITHRRATVERWLEKQEERERKVMARRKRAARVAS